MRYIDFINNFIKYTFLSFITFYVFAKSINYTNFSKRNICIVSLASIFLGVLSSFLIFLLSSYLAIFILLLLTSIICSYITQTKYETAFTITFIALAISLACYMISLLFASMLAKIPFIKLSNKNPIILIYCIIICSIIIHFFFKIKRFSKGFSFFKYKEKLYTFTIVGLILSGNLIILFPLLKNTFEPVLQRISVIGIFLIISGTYIWIKRNITLDYKSKMKDREIEFLKADLDNEKKEKAKILEENKSIAEINHKYSRRIEALERSFKKLANLYVTSNHIESSDNFSNSNTSKSPTISNTYNTEFSKELSDFSKLLDKLSSEFATETTFLKYKKDLPKTNVAGVDSLFELMKSEAYKQNITLDLKVNCSVRHLVENFISESQLATLIGDHIKDAIIAINFSNNSHREICAVFEIVDNCYQFTIFDSGISFEPSTLAKLGLETVTTHKDTGGSGFGFFTTFKTLNNCKASLIIKEIDFRNSNFNKSITFSFDCKSQYIICTNRIDEIKKLDTNNRIIFKDI